MTFCKLGHCVWRFSTLEWQNDNDERGVLFEESCGMKVYATRSFKREAKKMPRRM